MTSNRSRKPRIVYVVTHAQSARLLLAGHLGFMRRQGFEVTLICSPGSVLSEVAQREQVDICPVKIERELSPFRDIVALYSIFRLLVRIKPEVVNASTPKAGLLGMIASLLARVPVRIYVLRGLRFETTKGWKRKLLEITEKIASGCSRQVVCNSKSLMQACIKYGLAKRSKVTVLGAGSGNGVDSSRFQFSDAQKNQARVLGARLEIPSDCQVVGFVGRLTRDKGIVELVDSFELVTSVNSQTHLLLVGGFEAGDAVPEETIKKIENNPHISVTGFVPDTALYYSIFDLVVLPSYREGFPNVALEAAAAALPVVGYRATGTVDAVVDGVTGCLVEVGEVESLAAAILQFIDDPRLLREYGKAAQRRVNKSFLREKVWQAWSVFYRQHLCDQGLLALGRLPSDVVPQPKRMILSERNLPAVTETNN